LTSLEKDLLFDRVKLMKLISQSKRPENLVYAVDETPPITQLIMLGFQQVCIIAIYLVIVVIVLRSTKVEDVIVQNGVSLAMIALAIGAILQAIWKGPIGSGYLAPPVISAIYLQPSLLASSLGGLPLVAGMTILAGFFEIFISQIFSLLRKLFPALISGLIVLAVGLELGLIGVDQVLDVKGEMSSPQFSQHIFAGFMTLAIMIGFTLWGKGMFRLLSAMIGLLSGWLIALALGLISSSELAVIREAPLFRFPHLQIIPYAFEVDLLIPFLIGGLAGALRTIGVVTTCQKINDSNWKHPDKKSLKQGILADGLGCCIGGFLGTPGLSSSPSAVGISQVTSATSRVIAFSIASWFLLLACLPKVVSLFMIIPSSVIGATLMYTGSMMLVSGIQIIASNPIDIRKTFIIGISVFLGLSHRMFPSYFENLPHFLRLITGTGLSMTTLSALLLNFLFYNKRQSAEFVIDSEEKNIDEINTLIRGHIKNWGGNSTDADTATGLIQSVSQMLKEGQYADGPIKTKISFDETTLILDLYYQGKLLHLPVQRPLSEDEMVDELPMARGLAGFLTGIYPDRMTCEAQDTNCHLQIYFEL
jgi:xanthine permease XanP